MTPEVAVGMAASICACIREKNRWSGKAMLTGNQRSKDKDQKIAAFGSSYTPRASRIMQVVDPVAYKRPSTS
jgi:hypothetical protein